jgi:hypothetical protein
MAVRRMINVYYSRNALADLNCLQLDVRLGNSGLKISKIVLGCMSYGNDAWSGGWTLKGDEALEHFGEAFKMGINTYVLQANSKLEVRHADLRQTGLSSLGDSAYSNLCTSLIIFSRSSQVGYRQYVFKWRF